MSDKYDRVIELIEALNKQGINQSRLAEIAGYRPQNIAMMKKRKGFFNEMALHRIQEKLKVNTDWLKTGKGEMFLGDITGLKLVKAEKHTDKGTIFPSLRKHGEKLFDYGNPHLQVLTVPVDNENIEWCTVVPEFALASYSELFSDQHFIDELPKETIPEDLRSHGTVRKFAVHGDSMEPAFYQGDSVYASYTEITNRSQLIYKIQQKRVYVVNSVRGLFLKRVTYIDGDDHINLYSVNKAHPPFPMALDELRELWYVRRRYTAQFRPDEEELAHDVLLLQKEVWQTNQRIDKIDNGINDIKKLLGS
jgi:phage repressor protein C with HTH and peptisase S24 domain